MKKLLGLIVIWLISSAFTPARPRIRYSIDNQTAQSISTIVQLESDDSLFVRADTTEVQDDLAGGFVGHGYNHNRFKPYIKLLIQTNKGQYSTPVLLYKDRCTAYSIAITAVGLSVEESDFYRIRRGVIDWYIVFLITFFLRGTALLLFASKYINRIWLPFVVLNTALVILFQLIGSHSIIAVEWRFLPYALIPPLEFISYSRLSHDSQNAARLLSGIVIGGVLWLFPGYLLIVFGWFLFAGC